MGTWADITRKPEPALEPHQQLQRTGDETVRVAVVDANALIGGVDLRSLGDKCYTIQEVLNEIRDKQSREWLAALPFNIGVREPSEESLKSIVKFSQATGDLSTLSRPDLKLLALARTLEVELNGSEHLRENPAPARAYSRRPNRRQGTMPGWGRVSKPQEWAALDEADAQMAEQAVSSCVATEPQSLEQLLQQVEESGMRDEEQGEEEEVADLEEMRNRPGLAEQLGAEGSADACSSGGAQQADGEWQTACRSRGAARRRRRTEARRAERDAAAVLEAADASAEGSLPGWGGSEEEAGVPNDAAPAMEVEAAATRSDAGEEGGPPRQAEEQAAEEQGEGRRRSQVVCVTGDFAMQNVLLQMGLQLATRDGSRITELRRYVMRCHACCTVTREMERVFCGRCGNTTMERVEVLAGQGGEEHYGVNKRHVLKGTRYTLPKPRGGRFNNPVLREDVMLKKMRRKKAVEDVDPFAAEFGPDTWYRGGGAAASGRQGWTGVGPTITNYKNNPNERKMTTRSNRRKR